MPHLHKHSYVGGNATKNPKTLKATKRTRLSLNMDSTTSKGTKFENDIFELIERLLIAGKFFVPNKGSKIYKKKAYYSDKRLRHSFQTPPNILLSLLLSVRMLVDLFLLTI